MKSFQIATAGTPFTPTKSPFPLLRRLLLRGLRFPPIHPQIIPSTLPPAKNQVTSIVMSNTPSNH